MNKIRLRYSKGDRVKFISHLDLLRTFHRSIKRANIPVVYSQGFNPHQSVSFGPPLPVGTTSESEYLEIELSKAVVPEELMNALNDSLPQDIRILEAIMVEDRNDKFLGSFTSATYYVEIEFNTHISANFINEVSVFLKLKSILIEKQGKKGTKTVDILPDILNLEVLEAKDKTAKLGMKLSCGSVSNLKPELVIAAMNKYIKAMDIDFYKVHRKDMQI